MAHPALTFLRGQHGQSSIEFAAGIWVLLGAAMIAWQLALIGWTANQAANAARTAARDYSRVQDVQAATTAGTQVLSNDGFDKQAVKISISGDQASVQLKMPLIVPWIHIPVKLPAATATMPQTG